MNVKRSFLYLLRFVILLTSLGTLGCHIAQLALLGKTPGTGSWWPNYAPYTLYYVGSIVSVLSATLLLILGLFNVKSVLGDRIVSFINLLLLIAIAVYNSLESHTVPWMGRAEYEFISQIKGYAPYCFNYDNDNTFKRCWLVNGTWLGIIVTGFLWLLLGLFTLVQPNSDFYDEDYDSYDFKNDVPMAQPHQVYPQQQQSVKTEGYYYTQNEMDSMKYDQINYPVYNYTPERHSSYAQESIPERQSSNAQELYNLEHQTQSSASPNLYERERKVSKTLIEEAPPVQPPHTYDE